jgi:hypothetical protein
MDVYALGARSAQRVYQCALFGKDAGACYDAKPQAYLSGQPGHPFFAEKVTTTRLVAAWACCLWSSMPAVSQKLYLPSSDQIQVLATQSKQQEEAKRC